MVKKAKSGRCCINMYTKLWLDYSKEVNENDLFIFEPLIYFDNINILENNINYSSKVYNLIKFLKYENRKIYYCEDDSAKNIYLNVCFEVMKFFYRHKTYIELFVINIEKVINLY